MKFASWNIRGLNDPNKRFLVKDFVLRQSIDVIGIQESKLCKPNARKLRSIGGNRLTHWSILDSSESRGGIIVGWSNSFKLISSYVGIFSVSVSLIHITSNWHFTFTNVYAPIDREDKEVCWWELNRVRKLFDGPWIICGDFNATLCLEERNGNGGSLRDINSFRKFVSSTSLIDLPLSGR
ncbi:uncharacterized protein LOC109828677, partial [Asparagus officinalis]|uniref:uncharacterized protein LOC109828647 n=1 Tax=Asparagus officinalis TaxID=4686 RepID=UPI00098E69BB